MCCSGLLYEQLHGKEVLYVVLDSLPPWSLEGSLSCPGDTGTIPFCYLTLRTGLGNGAHRCDHDLAPGLAYTRHWARDGCHMYYVNAWALGWSREMLMNGFGIDFVKNYCLLLHFILVHYYSLLHNTSCYITSHNCIYHYYIITTDYFRIHYYPLLHILLLLCYY